MSQIHTQLLTDDASGALVERSFRLRVVSGPDQGKEHKLGPGSYFALTNKAPHIAKVEGNEEAVFFIQADGPWNVVMEK